MSIFVGAAYRVRTHAAATQTTSTNVLTASATSTPQTYNKEDCCKVYMSDKMIWSVCWLVAYKVLQLAHDIQIRVVNSLHHVNVAYTAHHYIDSHAKSPMPFTFQYLGCN